MSEGDTLVARTIEKDINTLVEDLNIVIEAHNVLVDKNKQLKEVIEEVKTEISSLMSKYFYEKDFCIEDIHLDKLLQILDKVKGE